LDKPKQGALLTLGFGTATAMWAAAYVARLPAVMAPGWLLLPILLVCLLLGGYAAGRFARLGWAGGMKTGLVASLLNLLILGSLLGGPAPNRIVPSALWWIPGSFLVAALLGAIGGLAGTRAAGGERERSWTALLARVAVAATFLLLIAGGVVTGKRAGLAVVDWPNSFGYNMFLYPLARMSGDIFYEHAHRLLGSLVGLTTLVLAIHVGRVESRRPVKALLGGAFFLVVIQGVMGGMRVTGRPTLSTSPLAMSPSVSLAAIHGVTGQIFFGFLVAAAVLLSMTWRRSGPPVARASAGTDRRLAVLLTVLLVVQITLGAILRHMAGGLHLHIALAVVVLGVAIGSGVRAWGLYEGVLPIPKTGISLLVWAAVQVLLGIAALIATGFSPPTGEPTVADVTITTIHQAVGALLLAHAVVLLLWFHRLVRPDRSDASHEAA